MTKIECFLHHYGIKPAKLAREANCTRQHLVRIRKGAVKRCHRSTKEAIAAACSRLAHRHVSIAELFD